MGFWDRLLAKPEPPPAPQQASRSSTSRPKRTVTKASELDRLLAELKETDPDLHRRLLTDAITDRLSGNGKSRTRKSASGGDVDLMTLDEFMRLVEKFKALGFIKDTNDLGKGQGWVRENLKDVLAGIAYLGSVVQGGAFSLPGIPQALPQPQSPAQQQSTQPQDARFNPGNTAGLPADQVFLLDAFNNRTPQEAANWLLVQAQTQKMAKQLIDRLVSTPDAQLFNTIDLITTAQPALTAFGNALKAQPEWFWAVVGILRSRQVPVG